MSRPQPASHTGLGTRTAALTWPGSGRCRCRRTWGRERTVRACPRATARDVAEGGRFPVPGVTCGYRVGKGLRALPPCAASSPPARRLLADSGLQHCPHAADSRARGRLDQGDVKDLATLGAGPG